MERILLPFSSEQRISHFLLRIFVIRWMLPREEQNEEDRQDTAPALRQTSSLLATRVERSDISGLFKSFKSLFFFPAGLGSCLLQLDKTGLKMCDWIFPHPCNI